MSESDSEDSKFKDEYSTQAPVDFAQGPARVESIALVHPSSHMVLSRSLLMAYILAAPDTFLVHDNKLQYLVDLANSDIIDAGTATKSLWSTPGH
jgi:hypothetical protein